MSVPVAWALVGVGLTLAPQSASRRRAGGARTRRDAIAAGCAVIVLVAVLRGLVLAAAAAAVLVAVASMVDAARRRTGDARRAQALLGAVRLLVAELDAGTRPPDAFRAAAGLSLDYAADFEAAAELAARGGDIASALRTQALQPIAVAWRVVAATGAPPAQVLIRVADDLAAAQGHRRRVEAATAGPRASALLLATLPVLGTVLAASLGAHPVRLLVDTSAGRLLCCAGVMLDVSGLWWTNRIVTRAERS